MLVLEIKHKGKLNYPKQSSKTYGIKYLHTKNNYRKIIGVNTLNGHNLYIYKKHT